MINANPEPANRVLPPRAGDEPRIISAPRALTTREGKVDVLGKYSRRFPSGQIRSRARNELIGRQTRVHNGVSDVVCTRDLTSPGQDLPLVVSECLPAAQTTLPVSTWLALAATFTSIEFVLCTPRPYSPSPFPFCLCPFLGLVLCPFLPPLLPTSRIG